MQPEIVEPRRTNLRTLELLRSSYDLVGKDYPVFLVLSVAAVVLGKVVPFQILLGPTMCGVFLAFQDKTRGRKPVFDSFAHGFRHFVDSLVATLGVLLVTLVFTVPTTLVFAGLVVMGKEVLHVDDAVVAVAGGAFAGFLCLVVLGITSAFVFVYPLIIVQRVSGLEALRLSVLGAWRNRVGVAKLVFVHGLLNVLGSLTCCVGGLLVQPIAFGAIWLAYRQVFPAEPEPEPVADGPAAGTP